MLFSWKWKCRLSFQYFVTQGHIKYLFVVREIPATGEADVIFIFRRLFCGFHPCVPCGKGTFLRRASLTRTALPLGRGSLAPMQNLLCKGQQIPVLFLTPEKCTLEVLL